MVPFESLRGILVLKARVPGSSHVGAEEEALGLDLSAALRVVRARSPGL